VFGNNFAAPHVCLWKISGYSEIDLFNFGNALDFTTLLLLLLVSMNLTLVPCFFLSRDEISGYSMMLLVLLLMLLEQN
jgi:hypothetical protein